MSNKKPLFTNRKTSSGHRKIPIAQATAGKLYRVRDKDWVEVWGENLTWEAANKLKNQVAAKGLSRTVRVEDMAIPAPAGIPASPCAADALAAAQNALAAVRKVLPKARSRVVKDELVYEVELAHGSDSRRGDEDLNDLVADLGSEPSDDDIDHVLRAADPRIDGAQA
jgi:endonuclease YncB( thermonuclease family)